MIKQIGSQYLIIGHSEQRKSGDTDIQINKKILSSINNNLNVIFCIGENLKQKKKNLTKKILSYQIKKGLNKVKNFNKIFVAYEPVWSIGSGKIQSEKELFKNIESIRLILKNIKNRHQFKILYGGSVNDKNIKFLSKIKNIDGFLIGGASQKPNKFIDIIKKSYI
jgi:triosephosphate isomerase